jgi:hypothetical protein
MSLQLEQDNISPRLLQAIEMASELPKDEQDELAQFILEEIADRKWEESPELRANIERSRAEITAGKYITLEQCIQQQNDSDGHTIS